MAFRFQKFTVYQDAKKLHKEIVECTLVFPRQYLYLADQIKRSSLSIALNIAEGSSKQSDKDFNRYITIALGSADETCACLEIAYDCTMISQVTYDRLVTTCEKLSNQLGMFSKKLKSN